MKQSFVSDLRTISYSLADVLELVLLVLVVVAVDA
jgi:hypothetical protein